MESHEWRASVLSPGSIIVECRCVFLNSLLVVDAREWGLTHQVQWQYIETERRREI